MKKNHIFFLLLICFCLFPGWEIAKEIMPVSQEETSVKADPVNGDNPMAPANAIVATADVALVVGNTSPSPGSDDATLKSKMEAMGHTVTYVSHNSLSISNFDANYDFALISETVSASTVNTQLLGWTKPIAVFERALIDDFNIGSGHAELSVSQIKITNSASLLAGGYSNGNQSLSGTVAYTTTANLASGADIVSTWTNNSNRSYIVSIAQGGNLTSGTAAGTRVWWGPATEGVISSTVWDDLFDGLIDYLVSEANIGSPPDAVTDLVARGGGGQIALSWSAPADNGASITGYDVEYRQTGAGSWTSASTSSSTTTVISGLSNSTSYECRVFAQNSAGTSSASNIASATTRAASTFKAVAILVGNSSAVSGTEDEIFGDKAAFYGHTVTYVDDNNINISNFDQNYDLMLISESVDGPTVNTQLIGWTKPIGLFERSLIDDFNIGSGHAELTISELTITNSSSLLAGGYANGNQSLSGVVAYTTSANLASGADIVSTWVTNNNRAFIASVLKGGTLVSSTAAGARVWWGPGTEGTIDSPVWDDLFEGLIDFLVGESEVANSPSAITDLSARGGGGQAELSWSAPDDNGSPITGYQVEYRTSGGGSWTTDGTVSTTTTIVTGLSAGTMYDFRVFAVNAGGTSSSSNEASATTKAASTYKSIAILVGNPSAVSGTEDEIFGDKAAFYGHTVTYVDDNSINLTSFDQNYDLMLISETVDGPSVNTQLLGWTKPIGLFERSLIDDFNIGSGHAELTVSELTIANSSSLLAGGYGNGNQSISGIVAYTTTANLASGADIVSTWVTNSARTFIASVPQGGSLTSGIAAGARVWWGPGTEGTIDSPVWDNLFEGLVDYLVEASDSISSGTNPPTAVNNLAASSQDAAVSLTWSPPSGSFDNYEIEHKLDASSSWTSSGTQTTTSITISSLTNGSLYNFRVRAVSTANGAGPWSQINATPEIVSTTYAVSSKFPNATPVIPGYYGLAYDIDIHPGPTSTVHVIEVTNLNGNVSSPVTGSWPWAIDEAESLVANDTYIYIVFKVSGVITLTGVSNHIWGELERVIICGQTAPGPVHIHGMETRPRGSSDILVMHLTFSSGKDSGDALWMNNCTNMVFKNCSFFAAEDELVGHQNGTEIRLAYINCMVAHPFESVEDTDNTIRRGKGGIQNSQGLNDDMQGMCVNTGFFYSAERNFKSRHSFAYKNIAAISTGSKIIDHAVSTNSSSNTDSYLYVKNLYAFDNNNVINGNSPARSNANGANFKPIYVQPELNSGNRGTVYAENIYYANRSSRTDAQNVRRAGGNEAFPATLASETNGDTFLDNHFDSIDMSTIPDRTQNALATFVVDNCGTFAGHANESAYQLSVKADYDNPTGTGNYVTLENEVPEFDNWQVPTISQQTGFRLPLPTASDRFNPAGAGGDGRFSEFELYLFVDLETSSL
ncbi:MAG: fibronectin type III domain-containing protein [Bacteroidota bacterium]